MTSKRVLRTPLAGQHRLSDAETTFLSLTEQNKHKIKGKPPKIMQTRSKRGRKLRLGVTL